MTLSLLYDGVFATVTMLPISLVLLENSLLFLKQMYQDKIISLLIN